MRDETSFHQVQDFGVFPVSSFNHRFQDDLLNPVIRLLFERLFAPGFLNNQPEP